MRPMLEGEKRIHTSQQHSIRARRKVHLDFIEKGFRDFLEFTLCIIASQCF